MREATESTGPGCRPISRRSRPGDLLCAAAAPPRGAAATERPLRSPCNDRAMIRCIRDMMINSALKRSPSGCSGTALTSGCSIASSAADRSPRPRRRSSARAAAVLGGFDGRIGCSRRVGGSGPRRWRRLGFRGLSSSRLFGSGGRGGGGGLLGVLATPLGGRGVLCRRCSA